MKQVLVNKETQEIIREFNTWEELETFNKEHLDYRLVNDEYLTYLGSTQVEIK